MKIKIIKQNILKLFEYIQIILIYLYAFLALNSNIITYFGEIPDFFFEYFPFIEFLISPQIKSFYNSEKSLFFIFLIIDIVTKISLPLTKIVKFNIVLVLILQMFLILTGLIWDLITNLDILESELDLEFEFGFIEFEPELYYEIDNIFFSICWFFYFILYLYCFICALQKKFPKFPGYTKKIIDSIIFLFNKQERKQKLN